MRPPLMDRSGIAGFRLPWDLFDGLERIPGVRAVRGRFPGIVVKLFGHPVMVVPNPHPTFPGHRQQVPVLVHPHARQVRDRRGTDRNAESEPCAWTQTPVQETSARIEQEQALPVAVPEDDAGPGMLEPPQAVLLRQTLPNLLDTSRQRRCGFGHIIIPTMIGDPRLAPVKTNGFIILRIEVAACPRAPFVEHPHGDAETRRAFPFAAWFLQPEDVPVDPVAARDEPERAVRVAPASRRVGHGGEPGPDQFRPLPFGLTERRGPFHPLPGQDHAGIRVAHPELAGFHAGHDRFLVRIPPQSGLIRFPMVAHRFWFAETSSFRAGRKQTVLLSQIDMI